MFQKCWKRLSMVLASVLFFGVGLTAVFAVSYECEWQDSGTTPVVNFTSCTSYGFGTISCLACDDDNDCQGCCWVSSLGFWASQGATARAYTYVDGVQQPGGWSQQCGGGGGSCLFVFYASGSVDVCPKLFEIKVYVDCPTTGTILVYHKMCKCIVC